jgi:molybdopterin synthase sulfur carrier subunit
MNVTVRYFASIREALGPNERLAVEPGASVGTVRDVLIARGGAHAGALARGRALRCALNQVMCDESALATEGAEIAFFPPVTGG